VRRAIAEIKTIPGEKGFEKLRRIGEPFPTPIMGEYTGAWYPFDKKEILLVDIRDAVYLIGMEFEPLP